MGPQGEVDRGDRHPRPVGERVPVDAGGDGGEGDDRTAVRGRELDRPRVAAGQQLRLAAAPAAPHRPDRVDHVPGRKPPGAGDLRLPGLAAAEPAALRQQLRTRRPMDGAVDPAAAEQAGVRRVDDRLGGDVGGDVPEVQRDRRHGPPTLPAGVASASESGSAQMSVMYLAVPEERVAHLPRANGGSVDRRSPDVNARRPASQQGKVSRSAPCRSSAPASRPGRRSSSARAWPAAAA
jgi:hypothetical protein